MNVRIQKNLSQVLHHLYINPLEKCNLRCKICYTRKTDPILSQSTISEFVNRYTKVKKIETITFCGGEVFTLSYFPNLINSLTKKGIFIQVITNGTIDKLDSLKDPNAINLIVSIDGLKEDHDANRGDGNFEKSIHFLKKAQKRGFHREIFSIITKRNFHTIDSFEKKLFSILEFAPRITYHPRKPPTYLYHHPTSNIVGRIEGFNFLSDEQMINVIKTRNVFPPKDLGCYQIAATSDGKVYGCCEGTLPIGKMSDPINMLIDKLYERVENWDKTNLLKNCLGCSQPDFMCGIKRYLQLAQN